MSVEKPSRYVYLPGQHGCVNVMYTRVWMLFLRRLSSVSEFMPSKLLTVLSKFPAKLRTRRSSR